MSPYSVDYLVREEGVVEYLVALVHDPVHPGVDPLAPVGQLPKPLHAPPDRLTARLERQV